MNSEVYLSAPALFVALILLIWLFVLCIKSAKDCGSTKDYSLGFLFLVIGFTYLVCIIVIILLIAKALGFHLL